MESSTLELIKRIRKFTDKPLCVGFGISEPEHVKSVIESGADGAIVGSAIITLIEKNLKNKSKTLESIADYIASMKKASTKS